MDIIYRASWRHKACPGRVDRREGYNVAGPAIARLLAAICLIAVFFGVLDFASPRLSPGPEATASIVP